MILAIQGTGLSGATRGAWGAAGVSLVRRNRPATEIRRIFQESAYAILLNLGNSGYNNDDLEWVWNQGRDIAPLVYPGTARTLLNEFMPPPPTEFPADVWVKPPGAGGRNKVREALDC